MARHWYLVFIPAFALLTSCATVHSPDQQHLCGKRPEHNEAMVYIRNAINHTSLKDPSSVQIQNIRVGECIRQPNIQGAYSAWIVYFQYNARNSSGEYVGFKDNSINVNLSESLSSAF